MPMGQKAKGRLGTALEVTGGIVSAVGMFPGAGILGGALSLGGSAMKPPAATKEDIKELFTNDVGTFWGLLLTPLGGYVSLSSSFSLPLVASN